MADIKNEARFKSDIPNEQWLQEKREDAELSGRNRFGVPKAFGPVTGRFDRNLNVSIEMLAVLPGERGEQGSVREDSLSYIRANWEVVSKLPLYVEIDPFGKPWVSEGNHRIMVAKEMGNLSLPTEVRYFGGGDRVAPADWVVTNLIAEDLKLGGANEIVGCVNQGEFVGLVMDVSADGVVTQKVNRNGDTVRHDLHALSVPVGTGDVIEIKYSGGVGVVTGPRVLAEVGR